MGKYSVEMTRDAVTKYYFIRNLDTMDFEPLPSKYLVHKTEENEKNPNNGTCNAYLKEVFRFYLFIEMEYAQFGSLKVFSYNQIVTANAVGVKKVIRSQSFGGYLKAEERNVRPAEQDEIITILQACTNCRDQLLILLIAETGYRIGEI